MTVGGQEVGATSGEAALRVGESVALAVRPERLVLMRPEVANGAGLAGVVRESVYLGTDTRFVVALHSGETVVARLQDIGGHGRGEFAVGQPVKVAWSPEDARALAQ